MGWFFVLDGTAQSIDPLTAIAERQPSATVADGRQVVAAHRPADPRENLLPRKLITRFQTKPPKDDPILVNHVRFRRLAVECATGGLLLMWTSGTHCIGRCHDLDSGFGLMTQSLMNRRHIGNKTRAVAFPTKPLQTEEGMASKTDWSGGPGVYFQIGHRGSSIAIVSPPSQTTQIQAAGRNSRTERELRSRLVLCICSSPADGLSPPADAGAEGETGERSGCWQMSDEKAESVLLCQCTIQDPTPDAFFDPRCIFYSIPLVRRLEL